MSLRKMESLNGYGRCVVWRHGRKEVIAIDQMINANGVWGSPKIEINQHDAGLVEFANALQDAASIVIEWNKEFGKVTAERRA